MHVILARGWGWSYDFRGSTQYIRFIAHSVPVWFLAVAAEFPAWRHRSECFTSLKAWLVSQSSVVGIRTFCQTIAKWCKRKCWEWLSEPFPVFASPLALCSILTVMAYLHCRARTQIPILVRIYIPKIGTARIRDPDPDWIPSQSPCNGNSFYPVQCNR